MEFINIYCTQIGDNLGNIGYPIHIEKIILKYNNFLHLVPNHLPQSRHM